jgi:nitroreductase
MTLIAAPTQVAELIRQRFSCREYRPQPIALETQQEFQHRLDTLSSGPFGSPARFKLVAATEQDQQVLRGLGTYGFIKNPAGFIVGAIKSNPKALEEYGYLMEQAILEATALGLGTCWLGGSFNQSSFGRKINLQRGEIMPAVTSIGNFIDEEQARNAVKRRQLNATSRKPWEELFFFDGFDRPLTTGQASNYATALEMVRLGPSASNKQPWRILQSGNNWHFYLKRTAGYGKGSLLFGFLRLADLQRVDIGIAMCHFEQTAHELGLDGKWHIANPGLAVPDDATEYVVSWAS